MAGRLDSAELDEDPHESRGARQLMPGGTRRRKRAALVARRLTAVIPMLFVVTLIAFFLLESLPGSTARQMLGANATEAQVVALELKLHLDVPAAERYWQWLQGLFRGELGRSIVSDQQVSTLIAQRMWVTFELAVLAFVFSIAIAIPSALLGSFHPGGFGDRFIGLAAMASASMAGYVLALLLVLLFSVQLGWFPSIGLHSMGDGVLQNLTSLTLPTLALAIPMAGMYTRFLRADLGQQLNEDYVTTALAKGLSRRRVLLRHVLPNSLFGLLTLTGLNFGLLMSGTAVIEQIFALPGLGQLLIQAVVLRDGVLVQGIVLVLVTATVAANLIVDLLYTTLDPRVRVGAT